MQTESKWRKRAAVVATCGMPSTPSVNGNASGSGLGSCSWNASNTGGVTTDGQIVYDVANDGKTPYT